MASLNVYIPDALKTKMDATQGVNWSSIARGLFESVVSREESTGLSLAEVAADMRDNTGPNSSQYVQGFGEGQAWASEKGELDDLAVLVTANLEGMLGDSPSGFDAATKLARSLGTEEDATFFFGEDGSYDPTSGAPSPVTASRLRGFVAGAMSLHAQVRQKLSQGC
jgi:hypothetical protein